MRCILELPALPLKIIFCLAIIDLTSSDVVAPVLVTVAITDTFWPALTVDGDISRSEYLKVVYDLKYYGMTLL
jgi:hypothetical protein